MNERVSVVIVAYNHKRYLADAVHALERSVGQLPVRLLLVDNASSDGTAAFVRAELMSQDGRTTKNGLPATFIASDKNLGFAGGNNLAIETAMRDGDAFVFLLNPDTEAQPDFLAQALAVMRTDPRIGIVQSLLILDAETRTINSWGNEIHFLGFGYAGGESVPFEEARRLGKIAVRDIAYASGAGMLVRTSLLHEIGVLNEELFAYHEDLEFSWRARLAGWRVVLAPDSVVHHKYEFSRSIAKWYWMERNRFLVLAWCYAWPTLILIQLALLPTELALWIFAFKGGWWREKLRAYAYILAPSHWPRIVATRRRVQALRRISDRRATALFTGSILFQQMSSPIVSVGNLALEAFWRLLRLVMYW